LSRPLETTDYLWALTRQIDRVAELATKYFDDSSRKPAFQRAKALVGSVLVLYSMALPVVEEAGAVDASALRANMAELVRALARDPTRHVKTALDAYSELIRALYLSKLLFRVGAEPIQV